MNARIVANVRCGASVKPVVINGKHAAHNAITVTTLIVVRCVAPSALRPSSVMESRRLEQVLERSQSHAPRPQAPVRR